MSRERVLEIHGERVVESTEFLAATLDELMLVVERGRDAFLADVLLQRAVEGIANRIGDTIRNRFPDTFLAEHPSIDWPAWVSWRTFLAHIYHRIDPDELWNDITRDVPPFRDYLLNEILGA